MSTSLDAALGDAPAEQPPVEQPEVQEAEPLEASVETQEQPEEPPQAEVAPVEPEKPEHTVPVSVVRELREEIRSLKAAQNPPAPAPDVLEDPKGYADHLKREVSQRVETDRLNMSEQVVRMTLGDKVVDDALAAFESKIGTPTHREIMGSSNPYKALVDWHKQQEIAQQVGNDLEGYAERIRAEERAKIEAELAAKEVRATPSAPSLASQSNLGVRTGPAWAGPTPIDKVIGE